MLKQTAENLRFVVCRTPNVVLRISTYHFFVLIDRTWWWIVRLRFAYRNGE